MRTLTFSNNMTEIIVKKQFFKWWLQIVSGESLGAMTHVCGSDAPCAHANAICCKVCGGTYFSTRLQKRTATPTTVFNMMDSEMEQLANYPRHDTEGSQRRPRSWPLVINVLSGLKKKKKKRRLVVFRGQDLDQTQRFVILFSVYNTFVVWIP